MKNPPLYTQNSNRFQEFFKLQCKLTELISDHPRVIKEWLDRMPKLGLKGIKEGNKSMNWRATRLNYSRRNKLIQLVDSSQENENIKRDLSQWLLKSVPVGSYIEIASIACSMEKIGLEAIEECTKLIIDYRNSLFEANLGLAFSVAQYEHGGSFDERCSDARRGLLDAVDRFVPKDKAVRFSFFANYWIKFQVSRGKQKLQSVVTFPINQQRIKAKSDRIQAQRIASQLPALTVKELAKELHVGVETVINSQHKPISVSINTNYANDEVAFSFDYVLSDPAPEPDISLAHTEVAERLREYYRSMINPETRVMLACMRDIGSLSEALMDYVSLFCERSRDLSDSLSDTV